ncbi:MAG TPA: DUF2911 domain-containing protein [Ferruginibacter sp.]|nr:hypothetical protein [Chitinophagaceae bacterium]HRI24084.1 DUF2911 domain-containing protein [Ferruginibacter sp.]
MFAKKTIAVPVSILLLFVSVSCNRLTEKKPDENIIKQIPVIVNDSNLLSIDRSPMDMIYFPVDYPKEKMTNPGLPDPLIRVIYSRPKKNNRIIFADTSISQNVIQHYAQDWRLGANEATEIEFFKPAAVNGKKIAAGRYIMYCIPYPDKWKIIFNSNLFSWGLHMDKTKDITETEVPVSKAGTAAEYFTMSFHASTDDCNLVMEWGDLKTVLPISFR